MGYIPTGATTESEEGDDLPEVRDVDFREAHCNRVEEVLQVLGRARAGAVIAAMLAGAERFSEIARVVPGASDSVLAKRLRELSERGLVVREVDAGPPTAISYHLTSTGRATELFLTAASKLARDFPDSFAKRA